GGVWPPVQRILSVLRRPPGCYRAVVAQCALIISDCAPGGVLIITECALATGVVIAPSHLAYRAATTRRRLRHPTHDGAAPATLKAAPEVCRDLCCAAKNCITRSACLCSVMVPTC